MIVFRLEHTLYMQYDQVMRQFLDEWMLEEIFGMEEDSFIFPLENGEYFGYSLQDNAFTKLQFSVEQRKVLHNNAADEWKESRTEAAVCRFLLMLVRRNNQVEPFADDYMISVLLKKLNQQLEELPLSVDVEINESSGLMVPILRLHGEAVSMEQFFLHIAMTSEKITQPIIQYVAAPAAEPLPAEHSTDEAVIFEEEPELEPEIEVEPVEEEPEAEAEVEPEAEPVAEAEPVEEEPETEVEPEPEEVPESESEPEPEVEPVEEELEPEPEEAPEPEVPAEIAASERDHFVKAWQLFEKIAADAEPGSEKYNSISFNMGELMYCRDDMSCAAYFYKLCDLDKIENQDDYFERLGHCYLDNKMGAFSGPLKLYFKAEQNEDFRKTHQEQLQAAGSISPEEVVKYRKLCIKQGKDNYKK